MFHASSAGATESSAALWSGDAPYLVSVSSPETAQDVPNYVSTAEIAADAVRTAVLDSYPDCVLGDDPGTWFGTPELDDSGRVARIPVGSETLTGAQVRALFSLRSAAFSVAYSGGTFTFTVTGSGHGVGGLLTQGVDGRGIAELLGEERHHGLNHFRAHRRGRGVIKVNLLHGALLCFPNSLTLPYVTATLRSSDGFLEGPRLCLVVC